jgi:Zn-dependent protease
MVIVASLHWDSGRLTNVIADTANAIRRRSARPLWLADGYIGTGTYILRWDVAGGIPCGNEPGSPALGITNLWQQPSLFICWIVLVVFSVCMHEFAHVYAAVSQGDDTAVRRGYLTLDPMKLMGIPSLIALLFIGIAWGAVPVTPSRMRHRYSHALVAGAGPGTNFLLAIMFALLTSFCRRLVPSMDGAAVFAVFFGLGVTVNCLLGILNVLPIPMFDGWTVASYFFPNLDRIPQDKRVTGGWIAIMVLFMTPAKDYFSSAVFSLSHAMLNIAGHVIPAAG